MQIHIPWHWTCRTWAGRCPLIFNTVFGAINDRTRIVHPGTGLVVEGFPRSGNSFCVFAFVNSGADGMELAHHVHSPSQIILAARYSIPAVLLVRSPADAVAAGLAKIATHTGSDLLRAYALYYESLLPLRGHYVIAPFETVTSDAGRVVSAVNKRFGTSYPAISPERHALLSKAFLAQEKLERLANPGAEPPAPLPPGLIDGPLGDQARSAYERMLAAAVADDTL